MHRDFPNSHCQLNQRSRVHIVSVLENTIRWILFKNQIQMPSFVLLRNNKHEKRYILDTS